MRSRTSGQFASKYSRARVPRLLAGKIVSAKPGRSGGKNGVGLVVLNARSVAAVGAAPIGLDSPLPDLGFVTELLTQAFAQGSVPF